MARMFGVGGDKVGEYSVSRNGVGKVLRRSVRAMVIGSLAAALAPMASIQAQAQGTSQNKPLLQLRSEVRSSMPGSMGIRFRFWLPAGRYAISHRFGGWDYYCASLEEAGASFPGLGSVVRPGDCVGLRRRQSDGELQWVVDNSVYNRMTTVWSRRVTNAEVASLEFVEPAPPVPMLVAAPPTPAVGSIASDTSGIAFNGSPVAIYAALDPSVLFIVSAGARSSSQGSAVAISPDQAITNCHVIAGRSLVGMAVGDDVAPLTKGPANEAADLCLVTSTTKLTPVRARRPFSDLKIGERVFAIGSPQGLQNTISEGIISGLRTDGGIRYIQTSAAISRGSSGGALVDEQGRLIGITTFKLREGESLNFAVSIDEMPRN